MVCWVLLVFETNQTRFSSLDVVGGMKFGRVGFAGGMGFAYVLANLVLTNSFIDILRKRDIGCGGEGTTKREKGTVKAPFFYCGKL